MEGAREKNATRSSKKGMKIEELMLKIYIFAPYVHVYRQSRFKEDGSLFLNKRAVYLEG